MINYRTICVAILAFNVLAISAKSFRVGNYEYETVKKGLYNNEIKLKKDYSNSTDAVIPETIYYEREQYTVGIIGSDAFKDNKRLMYVQIPGSVHALDISAFRNAKSLRKVTVLSATEELKSIIGKAIGKKPNSLPAGFAISFIGKKDVEKKSNSLPADFSIGLGAFANCEKLDSLDFSQRKTLVSAFKFGYPFENCKSLKSVVFGDVVFSNDGVKIFKGCHSLDNFVISKENPSPFKKLFEEDCPFMTHVYPKISIMSDSEYLTFLENKSKMDTIPIVLNNTGEDSVSSTVEGQNANNSQFRAVNDIMSVPMQRKDNNGNVCALLKVLSSQDNLSFEGNVIGNVEYKNKNQFWVYLSSGSQKIKINTPGIEPEEVVFMDYGVHHLDSKKIYEYTYIGIPTQRINIYFSPIEATVLIDGVIHDGDNGTLSADLPLGEHSYIVASRGYVTAEGVVKLKSEGQSNLNVTLTQTSK